MKQKRLKTGLSIGVFAMALFMALFLLTSCAANTPYKKAGVLEDWVIEVMEKAPVTIKAFESAHPGKYTKQLRKVKEVYNDLIPAVQVYQDAMMVWRTTDTKPVNYETVWGKVMILIGDMFTAGNKIGLHLDIGRE